MKLQVAEIVDRVLTVSNRHGASDAIIELDEFGDVVSKCTFTEFAQKIKMFSQKIEETFPGKSQLFIGISLPKGTDYYAFLLALLNTRHVYIPLPTSESWENLCRRADKVQVDAVICDATNNIFWTEKYGREAKITKSGAYAIVSNPKPVKRKSLGEDIAYIINTSGTTGESKAIVIGYRGLLPMIDSSLRILEMNPGDEHRVLQRSPLTADPSLAELFFSLLSGSTLYSYQESSQRGTAIDRLPSIVIKNKITMLLCPPDRLAIYHSLADLKEDYREFTHSLRRLLSTTDKASPDTLIYYASKNNLMVFDGYGPTETTIGLMTCKVEKKYLGKLGHIRVNTFDSMHIMISSNARVIKEGESGEGELCACGPGLMLGHCRDGELIPFRDLKEYYMEYQGVPYYRTGDLVRLDQDGAITFIRRLAELKLSGVKSLSIDVVKAKLKALLNEEVAVLKSTFFNGFEFYVQGEKSGNLTPQNIYSIMTADGALPFAFPCVCYQASAADIALINQLNTTPDRFQRQMLFNPSYQDLSLDTHNKNTETKIAELWCDVLNLNIKELNKNIPFSQYGGDSKSIMKMLLTLKKPEYNIKIDFNFFDNNMCLQELIDFIITLKAWLSVINIQPNGVKDTLFYFPPLAGDTFERLPVLRREIGKDINHVIMQCPLIVNPNGSTEYFQLVNKLSQQKLVDIKFLARVLGNLIVTSRETKEYHLIGYSFGGLLAAATACELQSRNFQVKYLGLVDTQVPIQAKLPLEKHIIRIINVVKKIIDGASSQSIRSYLNKYTLNKESGKGLTHRAFIIESMSALLVQIKKDIDSIEDKENEVSKKLVELHAQLWTTYYHLLLAFDFLPQPSSMQLKNVHCYIAGMVEDPETDPELPCTSWESYCEKQECFNKKFKSNTHSTMLSEGSEALQKIKGHVIKNSNTPNLLFDGQFGLPQVFNDFTGREKELADLEKNSGSVQVVTPQLKKSDKKDIHSTQQVHGTGGIGKTQLINHFTRLMLFKGLYKWAVWVRVGDGSEKRDELINGQFIDLAQRLGISVEKYKIEKLIELVLVMLNNSGKGLLVLDDVADYNVIKKIMQLKDRLQNIDVIITSRNSEVWSPQFKQIPLSIFEPNDALSYIKRVLDKSAPGLYNAVDAMKLATTLGFYPLALTSALAYIINSKGALSIDGYCDLFVKQKGIAKQLLNKKPFSDDQHQETIYTAVKLSLEKINDAHAEKVLKTASYFAPEAPIEFPLLNLCTCKLFESRDFERSDTVDLMTFETNEALIKLGEYGLIDRNSVNSCVQIHQIVQTIMRLDESLDEEFNRKMILSKAIDGYLDKADSQIGLELRGKYALPHLVLLVSELKKQQNDPSIQHLLANMRLDIGLILNHRGQDEAAREHFQESIQGYRLSRTLLGLEEDNEFLPNEAVAQLNLASATYKVGKPKETLEILRKDLYPNIVEDTLLHANCLSTEGMAEMKLGLDRAAIHNLERALIIVRAQDVLNVQLCGSLQMNLGIACIKIGQSARALVELNEAYNLLATVYEDENHPMLLICKNNLAIVLNLCGDSKAAQNILQGALPAIKHAYSEDHPMAGLISQNANVLSLEEGNYQGLIEKMELDYLTLKEKWGASFFDTIICHINLGFMYSRLGQWNKAEAVFYQCLQTINNEEDCDFRYLWGWAKNGLGSVLFQKGLVKKSIPVFEDAYKNLMEKLGVDHQEVLVCQMNLGIAYLKSKGHKRGLQLLESCYASMEAIGGPNQANLLTIRRNIATVRYQLGQQVLAVAEYADLKREIIEKYTYNNPLLGDLLIELAGLHKSAGYKHIAKEIFLEGLGILKKYFDNEFHPKLIAPYRSLAFIEQDFGNFQEAERLLTMVLNISEKEYGEYSAEVAQCKLNLAYLWDDMGLRNKSMYFIKNASDCYLKAYEGKPLEFTKALRNVALAYQKIKAWAEAEDLLIFVKSKYIDGLGESSTKVAGCLRKLGHMCIAKGDYKTAKEYFEQAMVVYQSDDSPAMHKIASCLNRLGEVSLMFEKKSITSQYFRDAYDIQSIIDRDLGSDSTSRSYQMNIGVATRLDGQPKQALELLEAAEQEKRGARLDNRRDYQYLVHIADCKLDLNEPNDSILKILEEALDGLRSEDGSQSIRVAKCMRRLGIIFVRMNQVKKGVQYYKEALSILTKELDEDHIETILVQYWLAKAYIQCKCEVKAYPILRVVSYKFEEFYGKNAVKTLEVNELLPGITQKFLIEVGSRPGALSFLYTRDNTVRFYILHRVLNQNMPLNLTMATNIADVFYQLGLTIHAKILLDMIVSCQPRFVLPYVLLAKCRIKMGDLDNIEQLLVQCEVAGIQENMLQSLRKAAFYKEIRINLNNGMLTCNEFSLLCIAISLRKMGRIGDAINYLKIVLEQQAPKNEDIVTANYHLAKCHFFNSAFEDAQGCIENAIAAAKSISLDENPKAVRLVKKLNIFVQLSESITRFMGGLELEPLKEEKMEEAKKNNSEAQKEQGGGCILC